MELMNTRPDFITVIINYVKFRIHFKKIIIIAHSLILIQLNKIITVMRKGAQSMYQPKATFVEGNALIKSSVQPKQKKVQGHDLYQTNKSKGNFEQTVNQLKKKPAQKGVEDEYIGGLQEEIKYLEYELKLLKDKEILEREGVNELDNFLKDQIPINENILAMKNKYNNTKTNLDTKLRNLMSQNAEGEGVLSMQKGEVQKLHDIINAHRKQTSDRKQQFKEKLTELMKELSLTKDQYEGMSKQSKKKQEQIKRLNEELAVLQRRQEKEKVQEVRAHEEKEKKMEKLGENSKSTKDELVETQQQIDELEELGETNPLLDPLQKQNSTLRKRIMLNEKQKSTAENIIAQIELFLKEESRERQIERQQKGKLTGQGDIYRTQLQHLERYVDQMIKDQTLRTKKVMLKDMKVQLTEKEQLYEQLTDRLRNLQQQCSNLIQQKKELTDSITGQKTLEKEFNEKISQADEGAVRNRSLTQGLLKITTEVTNQTSPTESECERCKGRIPIVERDIEKKQVMIHHLNKQIDLLKELKTLDMEQLQLISNGGTNVQNTLHSFIKNWEKIKSL